MIFDIYLILILIGDWGLGIGPNPQSPITSFPENKIKNNYIF